MTDSTPWKTAEIKNRIRAAWTTFYRHKQELTSRSYFLTHRLRLFNMMITPTLSYASGTWTLSKKHERMIRSTQRKILRFFVQSKRKYKKKTQSCRNDEDEEDKNANQAQTTKLLRVAVQTQITTKTATFPSWKTTMKRLTLEKLKKKVALNTWKEVQLKHLKGWKQQNGAQTSAPCTRQTDQWEDQKRDGKMK